MRRERDSQPIDLRTRWNENLSHREENRRAAIDKEHEDSHSRVLLL